MYTITLSTGRVLANLELNGNNFISIEQLTDADFAGALSKVVISDGNKQEEYSDMKLVACREDDGKTWFILAEKTENEKAFEAISAQLQQNATDLQDCMLAMTEMFESLSALNG